MWLSAGLGVGLAALYGMVSLVVNRRALQSDSQQAFMALVVGGMLARLAFTFTVLLIALLLFSLDNAALVGAFLIGFVPALAFEVRYLHRQVRMQTE